jgi:hypothetical protein
MPKADELSGSCEKGTFPLSEKQNVPAAVMALPAKWRDEAYRDSYGYSKEAHHVRWKTFKYCADELEQALPELERMLAEARLEEVELIREYDFNGQQAVGMFLEKRLADLRAIVGKGEAKS